MKNVEQEFLLWVMEQPEFWRIYWELATERAEKVKWVPEYMEANTTWRLPKQDRP